MGCDIHLYVESRSDSGQWQPADKWVKNPYGYRDPDEQESVGVRFEDRFYRNRNYDLFAILADVRNGRGFAGVDTGDGFVPIAEARGLPDDVTSEVRACSEGWGVDGHSHSHFTVAELLAYDWTRATKKRGVVNAVGFAQWKARGQPDSYCGGVWGGAIRQFDVSAFEAALAETIKQVKAETAEGESPDIHPLRMFRSLDPFSEPQPSRALEIFNERLGLAGGEKAYATVEWETPYYEQVGEFLSSTMPKLWRLGKPDDVRIVFWFDN